MVLSQTKEDLSTSSNAEKHQTGGEGVQSDTQQVSVIQTNSGDGMYMKYLKAYANDTIFSLCICACVFEHYNVAVKIFALWECICVCVCVCVVCD